MGKRNEQHLFYLIYLFILTKDLTWAEAKLSQSLLSTENRQLQLWWFYVLSWILSFCAAEPLWNPQNALWPNWKQVGDSQLLNSWHFREFHQSVSSFFFFLQWGSSHNAGCEVNPGVWEAEDSRSCDLLFKSHARRALRGQMLQDTSHAQRCSCIRTANTHLRMRRWSQFAHYKAQRQETAESRVCPTSKGSSPHAEVS